jgi:NAD(P)H-flavin reductase
VVVVVMMMMVMMMMMMMMAGIASPIIKCGRCDAPRHHACVDGPVPTGGKVRGG